MVLGCPVLGLDDLSADGDQPFLLTASVSSSDPAYDGLRVPPVIGHNRDDEEAAIVLLGTAALATAEGAGASSYEIRLGSEPAGAVTVVASADGELLFSDAMAASSHIVFGPTATGNGSGDDADNQRAWDDPAPVTVVARDDDVVEGEHSGVLTHVAYGAPDYTGVRATEVAVIVVDND